ncbi:hypothetical protein WN944_023142 [Citrus x changshan-huyou]|uniref:Uncharacterized protein n=1 Tax=Citrus x changshan-huyou TaxID=2935761 RepID=A0AAP0R100_9ROSI
MAALTKQVNTHKEIEDTRRRWHGSRHGNIDSTTAINHRLTNTTAQSQAITSLRCTEEPAIGRLLLSLAPPAAVTVATVKTEMIYITSDRVEEPEVGADVI